MKLNCDSALFQQLAHSYERIKTQTLLDLFHQDSGRVESMTIEHSGLVVDFSKNLITPAIMRQLYALLESQHYKEKLEALYNSEIVNQSEGQAAEHILARDLTDPRAREAFEQTAAWVERIEQSDITDVVQLGIGGSDLGPRFVCEALMGYRQSRCNVHFLSSHDSIDVNALLLSLNPKTTLFLVVSKSFTTQETMLNWGLAKAWLETAGQAPLQHMLAITARSEVAERQGIPNDRILTFWPTIGGRYSLWSAVGLIIALWIGVDNFKAMLNSAHLMDQSVLMSTPDSPSLPVISGLLAFWYGHFFKCQSQAIVAYAQRLKLLPDYMQQLHMESLGKRVTQDGQPIDYPTGMVIWGGVGTDCQHSFHQLFMQGRYHVPVDFILPLRYNGTPANPHLIAHCLAQGETLMRGYHETSDNYKYIPGNNPSTTIMMESLNPSTVGALLAMYEHRVFVDAVLWDINPFDQWGVERGKVLAKTILDELSGRFEAPHDPSTQFLIQHVRNQS